MKIFPPGRVRSRVGILPSSEVYEALSEADAVKYREELIQVAAVAIAMYEASMRSEAPKLTEVAQRERQFKRAEEA